MTHTPTYIPNWLRQPPLTQAVRLAERISFGSVVAHREGSLMVAHVPIELRVTEQGAATELLFHFANGNPLSGLTPDDSVVVIFRGPDGYISPTWYDHENVPTWDYACVHMSGPVAPIDDGRLKDHVKALIAHFEPELEVRDAYIDQYLSWIKGFVMPEPAVEPVYKLSQDKSEASVTRIVDELRKRGSWLDGDLADEIDFLYGQRG